MLVKHLYAKGVSFRPIDQMDLDDVATESYHPTDTEDVGGVENSSQSPSHRWMLDQIRGFI